MGKNQCVAPQTESWKVPALTGLAGLQEPCHSVRREWEFPGLLGHE